MSKQLKTSPGKWRTLLSVRPTKPTKAAACQIAEQSTALVARRQPWLRPRGDDSVNQTKCWIATHGWMWMENYFDDLPVAVRQRLRNSPFNLCPACLVTEFLPEVRRRHGEYTREKALLAAIEIMESELRKGA
jgi:hypothetical protein